MADSENYSELNLEELQQELKARHQPHSGNKPDLVKRLQDYDDRQSQSVGESQGSQGSQGSQEGDSSENLQGDTTTPEPPEDDVSRGDPGEQYPEHGSIGLKETNQGYDQASVLQGLSDDRRAAQLAAVEDQEARRSAVGRQSGVSED